MSTRRDGEASRNSRPGSPAELNSGSSSGSSAAWPRASRAQQEQGFRLLQQPRIVVRPCCMPAISSYLYSACLSKCNRSHSASTRLDLNCRVLMYPESLDSARFPWDTRSRTRKGRTCYLAPEHRQLLCTIQQSMGVGTGRWRPRFSSDATATWSAPAALDPGTFRLFLPQGPQ